MAIHGLRRPAVLLLVASLAALVFIFSSANDTVRANLNFVGYPTSLSDTTPGANADITTLLQEPAPNSFPWGGTVAGTPNGFGVALDGADLSSGFPPGPPTGPAVPNGAVVGSLTSVVQLAVNALGANACFAPVIVPFAMVDATVVGAGTTGAGTIGGSPADTIWPGNSDSIVPDGLPDAVTLWPTFLNGHLQNLNPGGAAPVPIARYHGQILVAPPSPTNLELVFFAPGSLPDFPASMGTLSVSYLEDSLAPTNPSAISNTCTAPAPATFVTTTISGVSLGAAVLFPNVGLPPAGGSLVQIDPGSGFPFPGTDVCDGVDNNGVNGVDEGCGFLLRQNPAAGSYIFKIAAITGRDTDNDGITNQLDPCPLHVDANTVLGPQASGGGLPFDILVAPKGVTGVYSPPFGPGYNPYWPAPFVFPQPQDPDDDNLTSSCDPSPFVPSPGGPFGFDEDLFSEGFTPPFTRFFSNGQDNCALVGNPSQLNSDASIVAINIGPDSDFMGDHPAGLVLPKPKDPSNPLLLTPPLCDPNPFVSDGHAHMNFGEGPVCVGGTDADGDGWCASDDPDDSDPSIQVEDIAFDRTCFDGADNDGDGTTDLADTGCQLPDHDLALRNIRGSRDVVCGQSNSYQVVVKNLTPDRETFKIAFLIDTTATGYADALNVTVNAIVSDGLVAGTAEVGSINHDSGGYPAAQTAPIGSLATDLEVEGFATADVTVNGHAARPVKVEVTWNCMGPPPADGNIDFTVNVDICHLGDPTLGLHPPLLPLGDDCGLTGSDGGQDRVNTGNDATLTKTINVH